MSVSYKRLLKLLVDRDMKKQDLVNNINISWKTMAKLSKEEYVSLRVIEKICQALNCQPNDIMEIR